MRFNQQVSFNTIDSSTCKKEGRIVVKLGMAARCRAILLLLQKKGGCQGVADMRDALGYSYTDALICVRKLRKEGIVAPDGYGRWVLTSKGISIWNRAVTAKERI